MRMSEGTFSKIMAYISNVLTPVHLLEGYCVLEVFNANYNFKVACVKHQEEMNFSQKSCVFHTEIYTRAV